MRFEAKYLIYSRTRTVDYRWLFLDKNISAIDEMEIEKDFQNFQLKYYNIRKIRHLYIRRMTSGGIAIYKFYETDRKDFSYRNIMAISGLFFSQSIYNFLEKIVTHCFFDLDYYSIRLFDEYERLEKEVNYYFDENNEDDMEKIKLSKVIKDFLLDNKISNFCVIKTNDSYECFPLENSIIQKQEESSEASEILSKKGFLNFIKKIFK